MNIDLDNPELQKALQVIEFSNRSLFLTGKAGTGKSTFLKHIAQTTKKKHVILAPTGIAALNAGGVTLHSFFKIPFYPLRPDDVQYTVKNIRKTLRYNNEKIKTIRELELIIIDEISMVRADIIDFIDKVLRIYSNNQRQPFGGKQLLFVGDLFQLEPVLRDDDKQILSPYYPSLYFFNAIVFREKQVVSIELTKVYRQTDNEFIKILDNIRTSQVSVQDIQKLNTRVNKELSSNEGSLSITLSTTRDVVDSINEEQLNKLPGDKNTYKGCISGDFSESMLPTPIDLELKVGAQIIFIKNDMEHRWVNGTLGTVIALDDDGLRIYVRSENGQEWEVERDKWSNMRYTFNEEQKKIEEEEIGSYIQFPVKLAWAITVHKSQGLTFNNVNIDFGHGVFAAGQTYVALSRCRSLEGINLKQPIRRSDIFVREEVQRFARHFNDQNAINAALKDTLADKQYHDAVKAFDKGDMETALQQFFLAIHNRYEIEKPVNRRFIRRKLNIINTLQEEINRLNAVAEQQQAMLTTLAAEYTLMGRECEREGMTDAAIANYRKALKLNPDALEPIEKIRKLGGDIQ